MLFAIDLDEDFVNIEGVAIATMSTLQPLGIFGSEFDTPEANSLVADCDTAFWQEILDISVTEIEPVVEPDSVGNDIGWESVVMRWTPIVEPAS